MKQIIKALAANLDSMSDTFKALLMVLLYISALIGAFRVGQAICAIIASFL